ncbi:MAG: FKBP-type peptidyl-prolyl cis-trans isomerase [Gemmatimonadota bacterium]
MVRLMSSTGSVAQGAGNWLGARAAGVLLLIVVTALSGCLSDSGTDVLDPTEIDFAASLGVDLAQMTRSSSGLYIQDEVVGDGEEARAGDEVSVHYQGWLSNGNELENSRTDGFGALTIEVLGGGEVIPGWDEGLVGMREGGTRLLVIPPHLAYGRQGVVVQGVSLIPSNATLVFRVEMLEVTKTE